MLVKLIRSDYLLCYPIKNQYLMKLIYNTFYILIIKSIKSILKAQKHCLPFLRNSVYRAIQIHLNSNREPANVSIPSVPT